MKRSYSKSSYAKPCEEYCREVYPDEAEKIFERAEKYYLNFMKDMPDLGKNIEALGGDCCDYWYVGDKSPALEQYKNLKEI